MQARSSGVRPCESVDWQSSTWLQTHAHVECTLANKVELRRDNFSPATCQLVLARHGSAKPLRKIARRLNPRPRQARQLLARTTVQFAQSKSSFTMFEIDRVEI
jgi:hypothetical protein